MNAQNQSDLKVVQRGSSRMEQSRRGRVSDDLGRMRQPISIRSLLEWAFAAECASIDFEDAGTLARGYSSVGTEWVMMQAARLGCRVDGGGRSDPDPDADLVASAVAMLPVGCGGRGMAVQVAELARARMVPECYAGVVPRCVPVGWKGNRHGRSAITEHVCHVEERGLRKVKSVEVRVCPVTYHPQPAAIAAARRNYLAWYGALLDLSATFRIHNNLSRWQVTDELPPCTPWKNIS